MKKILIVLICIIMLVGCNYDESNDSKLNISKNVPEDIDVETYENAKTVLEITDSFLNGEISAEKAISELDTIDIIEYDENYLESCDSDEEGFPIDNNLDYPKNPAINEAMRLIETYIGFINEDFDETSDESSIQIIEYTQEYISENIK